MQFIALILALLFLSCAPQKANATACTGGCIQFNSAFAFSGTTISVTLTGVVAGHNIRVFYCADIGAATGLTVGGTTATLFATSAAGGGKTCGAGYFANSTSGSVAVVVTVPPSCGSCAIQAEEWAGDVTSSAGDGENAQYTASGGSPTSIPCSTGITTTNANDNIEAVMFQAQSIQPTNPAGFNTAVSNTTWYSAYMSVSATGTYNPTFTSGSLSFDNTNICVAFKSAGGGGPTINSRALLGVGQ